MSVKEKSIILVNATNLEGGGFNILKQFLEAVKLQNDSIYYWIVFVPSGKDLDGYSSKNIELVCRPDIKKSWFRRAIWDLYGLKRYADKHYLKPSLIISLQNTGVRFPNIKQIVYIHQSLVLEREFKWSLFNAEQREYALRKYLI